MKAARKATATERHSTIRANYEVSQSERTITRTQQGNDSDDDALHFSEKGLAVRKLQGRRQHKDTLQSLQQQRRTSTIRVNNEVSQSKRTIKRTQQGNDSDDDALHAHSKETIAMMMHYIYQKREYQSGSCKEGDSTRTHCSLLQQQRLTGKHQAREILGADFIFRVPPEK